MVIASAGGSQSLLDDRTLDPGTVHLWHAWCDFQSDGPASEACRDLLSEDERLAEQKFRFAEGRSVYRLTRAMARIVLSRYLDLHPADCRFERDRHGRPVLAHERAVGDELTFSISHSHRLIVMGVTRGARLGVDIERVDEARASVELADRFFSPREAAHLRSLPATLQTDAFFTYWTLKEAYVKALGLGLSVPLNQFAFELGATGIVLHHGAPGVDDAPDCWNFQCLQIAAHYAGAVCVARMRGPEPKVIHRRFQLPQGKPGATEDSCIVDPVLA